MPDVNTNSGSFPVNSRIQAGSFSVPISPHWRWWVQPSEIRILGFTSKKYHPVDDLDAEAWNALNLRTRYYTTRLHKGAFYLPAFLEDMLKEVED